MGLATETSLSLGISAKGTHEVNPSKIGPQRFAEVELGVGTLPQQEARQSLLTRGSNNQIRIGLASGVEVIRYMLNIQYLRKII